MLMTRSESNTKEKTRMQTWVMENSPNFPEANYPFLLRMPKNAVYTKPGKKIGRIKKQVDMISQKDSAHSPVLHSGIKLAASVIIVDLIIISGARPRSPSSSAAVGSAAAPASPAPPAGGLDAMPSPRVGPDTWRNTA